MVPGGQSRRRAQALTWHRAEAAQLHSQQVAGLRQLPLSILHVDRAAQVVHLRAAGAPASGRCMVM